MCLTYPAEVVALDADGAVVRMDGRLRRASTLTFSDLAIGDRVIVAAGAVITRLDLAAAQEMERLVRVARGDDQVGGP